MKLSYYTFLYAIVRTLPIITFFCILGNSGQPKSISGVSSATIYKNEVKASFKVDNRRDTYSSVPRVNLSLKKKHVKLPNWKEQRKLLKARLKAIKKSGDLSTPAKIALTALSVLLSVGLVYLIYILALVLALSDLMILAFIVFYGGLALIIILLYVMIRKIYKKKNKPGTDIDKIPKEESQKPGSE